MSASRRLSIHHVGARAGGDAFPNRSFDADVVCVLYDADPACSDEIVALNRDRAAEVHVLPVCLGARREVRPFFVTRSPYGSSLYKPAALDFDYYAHGKGVDQRARENTEVVKTLELQVESLDGLYANGGAMPPPPDFLSLDTQGSEADILDGARRTIDENTVAIVSEVEFQELYEGQPLFHDVAARLEEFGFVFARFLNLPEMPPYRGPLGFRGDGFHTYADALFLRRPKEIAERFGARRELALRKLILTAIAHGQIEFALLAGETLDADRREDPEGAELLSYERFVESFLSVYGEARKRYPATFAERCAGDQAETMVARPDAPQAPPGDHAWRYHAVVGEDAETYQGLLECRPSPLETLLVSHGFTAQAETVMKRRREHTALYLKSLQ
jgi:FkbM family methyltransferase